MSPYARTCDYVRNAHKKMGPPTCVRYYVANRAYVRTAGVAR